MKIILCCKNAPYQKAYIIETESYTPNKRFDQVKPESLNEGVFHCDDPQYFCDFVKDIIANGSRVLGILKIDDAITKEPELLPKEKEYPESWHRAARWKDEHDPHGNFLDAIRSKDERCAYELAYEARDLYSFAFDCNIDHESPFGNFISATSVAASEGAYLAIAHALGVNHNHLMKACVYHQESKFFKDEKPLGFEGLKKVIENIK